MAKYNVGQRVMVKSSGAGIVEDFPVTVVALLIDKVTGESGVRIRVPSGREFDISEAHLDRIKVERQWEVDETAQ